MRDWNVPGPRSSRLPLDYSMPEPTPRPDEVQAPWGETYRRHADGYYRVRPQDAPLGYAGLLDRIDRFELRWQRFAVGRCYRVVPVPAIDGGPRIAVLWRNADGTYRSGHVALRGPRDGVWLARREPFRRAASRAELWWLGLGLTRPGRAPQDEVARRLRP